MQKLKSASAMALLVVMAGAFGCSQREAPTLTPSENSATPTYRSTTNSWEVNSAPKYTQSGINGGEPATLPAIPSPDRFSENTPLAMSVYSVLHADVKVDSRYISVYTKGRTVRLQGTAPKSESARILSDIHSVSGIKAVHNELQMQ
jgi:hypothetical protein